MTPATVPLWRQIACAKREVRLRLQVYPKLIAHHKMTEEEAQEETLCMQAILATLHELIRTPQTLHELAPDIKAMTSELLAGRFVGKATLLRVMTRLEALLASPEQTDAGTHRDAG
jgi:hypothetical protein